MARNYVQQGDVLDVVFPGNIEAGQPTRIGSLFGVALSKSAAGQRGSLAVSGAWHLPKSSAAFAWGAPVYWNEGLGIAAASGSLRCGVAAKSAATGDASVLVLITGMLVEAGGGAPPATTSPSGAAITRVTEKAESGFHFLSGIPNETGAGAVTVELEVKIAGAMNGTDMFSIGGPSSSRVMVSLVDGAKLSETGMSGTVTSLGGGWYRVEAVHVAAGDSYYTINLFRDYSGSYAGNTDTSVDFGRLRVINAGSSTTTTPAITSLTANGLTVAAA